MVEFPEGLIERSREYRGTETNYLIRLAMARRNYVGLCPQFPTTLKKMANNGKRDYYEVLGVYADFATRKSRAHIANSRSNTTLIEIRETNRRKKNSRRPRKHTRY